MPLTMEQLKMEAMKLGPEERADLADWLWASTMPRAEVTAAWAEEISRRTADANAGKSEVIPREQVVAQLRNILPDDNG